jgi:large conductance mechanosensitive channel
VEKVFGKPDFTRFHFTLHNATFYYGTFITAVITFVIVAATLFFLVVKPVNLMMDRFRLSPASQSPATKTCPACFTDIPVKASRCPNCTSELAPPPRGTPIIAEVGGG